MSISQICDLYHEPHHGQCPPPFMPYHNSYNRHSHINLLNNDHTCYVKLGSRFDMGKIQGDKMNKRGKNDDLEMD